MQQILVNTQNVSVGYHQTICYPQCGGNGCSQYQVQKEDQGDQVPPNTTVLLAQQSKKHVTERRKSFFVSFIKYSSNLIQGLVCVNKNYS